MLSEATIAQLRAERITDGMVYRWCSALGLRAREFTVLATAGGNVRPEGWP